MTVETAGATAASWKRGLLPALAVGLLLRIWYFIDLCQQSFFGYPIIDSLTYKWLAEAILAGQAEGAYFRPPLYPYLLATVYEVFGQGQGAIVWIQFALGLATIVPAYLLARRWFGNRSAVITAWVLAVYPLRIFFEGEILAVTLFSFLLVWGFWLFWRGLERRSALILFAAGLLFGLAIDTRPVLLAALPFLVAGGMWIRRGERPWSIPLPIAVGIVLAVAPVTIHNWEAERSFIPVAANGGVNFYLGNRVGATGETPLPPGVLWEEMVQEPIRAGQAGPAEQDAYWWSKGRAEVAEAPFSWFGLLFSKGFRFWNAQESSNNKSLEYFTAVSLPVRYYGGWFGLLVILAAAGATAHLRKTASPQARNGTVVTLSLVTGYFLVVTAFFITARYRIPLIPFLAMLAATGGYEIYRAVSDKQTRKAATLAAAALITAVLVLPDWWGTEPGRINGDFQMAEIHLDRHEPAKSLEYLRLAQEQRPDDVDVLHLTGTAHSFLGNLDAAAEAYRRTLEHGEYARVYFNLGVIYQGMGPDRFKDAEACYVRALQINPLDNRARTNLSVLRGRRR